jgi:hypothetical protein
METMKIGFVPAHGEPFDENWGAEMRRRCLDVFGKIPLLEVIVPDEHLTKKEGFTHHASLIHGDFSRAITDACEYLGIETIVV